AYVFNILMFNDGNTNVQKVSEMCGFRDIKSFRESFKKKMNIAPKQFILQLGKAAKDDKKEKEDEAQE
ncbi:MAG: AraC family transcriptional regulator, partial [Muribaculaceae bacterium]|nr:AraC family transcriptional regulator [Muribaculaceae bacterium]